MNRVDLMWLFVAVGWPALFVVWAATDTRPGLIALAFMTAGLSAVACNEVGR